MKIKVYGLKECGFCKNLAAALEQRGIPFKWIDAEDRDFDSEVSKLESFFDSTRYPKVILFSNKTKTVFVNPYEGTKLDVLGDNIFEYYNSLEDILELIEKYKNEI